MKILRRLLTVLAALVLFGVVCAAGLIGFVYYKETHLPPVGGFDTIIVLGAQVKAGGTPSVALERRLTAALEEAYAGIKAGDGGPFGTVIVKDGEIVGRGQ